jgi:hypothetical protein
MAETGHRPTGVYLDSSGCENEPVDFSATLTLAPALGDAVPMGNACGYRPIRVAGVALGRVATRSAIPA